MKKKVLIMSRYYIPGVKGGGPIQSIRNLIENLSGEFQFYIITGDRDIGDKKPFGNVSIDKWSEVGNANVYYLKSSLLTLRKINTLINSADFDILYLNSFFDYKYGIIPILLRRFGKLTIKTIILAPRGEFSLGALAFKHFKKALYINISALLRLYRGIIWHATTDTEKFDILRIFGTSINVKVARNLTSIYKNIHYDKNIIKNVGELKLVYISRIHPNKNLLQVLEILKNFDDKIDFNIYGPKENLAYWYKCEKMISQINNNVRVSYNGIINNDEVNRIYKENHVSILLTLGENFGHSISEALIGGCPVIISDKTPWRNIDKFNSGWDIPLKNSDIIAEKIRFFIGLDNNAYKAMSQNAFEYAKSVSNSKEDILSHKEMLNT